jgi:hypothetical protein
MSTFKSFKYELALGAAIEMPKPKLDFFPNEQYSVQQYLHTLCKANIGSLGKKGAKWAFAGPDSEKVKLSTRPDVTEIFDYAEQLKIIVPKPDQSPSAEEGEEPLVVYQLSEAYWDRFDKFAS